MYTSDAIAFDVLGQSDFSPADWRYEEKNMIAVLLNNVDVFVEESEKSLQINNIHESDFDGVWEALVEKYPGYSIDFCFKGVALPEDKLCKINARVIDDCVNMNLVPECYTASDSSHVMLLADADYEEFAALYDSLETDDMYWTSELMKKRADIWRIFIIKTGGKISDYITLKVPIKDAKLNDVSYGEIFSVRAANPDNERALVDAAARCTFENGKSEVIYMVDYDNAQARAVASTLGFKAVGFYKGYTTMIPPQM